MDFRDMLETSKNCINNIQSLGLDKVLQKQALYMKAPTNTCV
jgi:hypothetical protein